MKKEIRNITSPLELRSGEDGKETRHIEGYALVFNTRSEDLGGFTETISPGALEGVLERSDVLALLNHDMCRGVLARYRNGGGSLKLEVDEKGLRYSFDCPNTALGDEVLEGVRRGDITGSSFAFTVEEEGWEKQGEGYLRTIKRFGQLFDVSPVYNPAYMATSVEVDSRGLDALKEKLALEEKREAEEKKDDEEKDPDPEEGNKSGNPDDKEKEPNKEPENNPEEEDKEEDNKRDLENINIHTQRTMKKEKFSLLRAIRAAANREEFDDAAVEVFEEGKRAAQEAGVEHRGTMQIPLEMSEKRFEDSPNGIIASQTPEGTVTGMGGEVVPTELFDILGPLRDRMVLSQLGARMLNLSGNVEIPLYSGAQADWASEIETAKETAGKFSKVKLSPKRLTAVLPISKQFLIQTSASAEALLRQNLIDCVADKFQGTVLGAEVGTDTRPQGLMYGVVEDGTEVTFEDLVNWEAELEDAKIFGEKKYVLSPLAKAKLRTTRIDKGSGLMCMQNNEVLGIPALSTGSIVKKGLILGDWSNLYIATFGALDLTVDPYTRAKNAQIELVVNMWLDYAVVRPEAFVKHILK